MDRVTGIGAGRTHRRRSADRSARARLLAGGGGPDAGSRTRSTRPTPSRWRISTQDSTPNSASRSALSARHCSGCRSTRRRRSTGNNAVSTPKPSWRRSSSARRMSATGWSTPAMPKVLPASRRLPSCPAARAHEVVRLEHVAEQAAASPGDYASAFEHILRQRAATRSAPNPSWLTAAASAAT